MAARSWRFESSPGHQFLLGNGKPYRGQRLGGGLTSPENNLVPGILVFIFVFFACRLARSALGDSFVKRSAEQPGIMYWQVAKNA